MKKLIIILVIALIAVGGGFALHYLNNYETTLYAKIDNAKIHSIGGGNHPDGLKYEYALPCYTKNGREKVCQFKTSRELREAAYLKLTVRAFGVHNWAEISHDDLPDKVQSKI